LSIAEYTPLITASAALLGVLSGGVITFISNSQIKNKELRHQLNSEYCREKRIIYAEFISSINMALIKSLQDKSHVWEQMNDISGQLAKIELIGDPKVHAVAKQLMKVILDSYKKEPEGKQDDLLELRKLYVKEVKLDLENTHNKPLK